MTSMEAACESARHAVNAILDHYVWVETGGADRREITALDWRIPFGFLDQGFSSPVRLPSPAGDYCFVFDIENREPLDALPLRNLDSQCLPSVAPAPPGHRGRRPVRRVRGSPSRRSPPEAQPMTTSPNDYTGQLLTYLQAWRQYLEHATSAASPSAGPGRPGPRPRPGRPWPAPNPPVPDASGPTPPALPRSGAAVPPGWSPPGPLRWPHRRPRRSPPPARPDAERDRPATRRAGAVVDPAP